MRPEVHKHTLPSLFLSPLFFLTYMHTYTQPISPSLALSRTANILNNSINPKTNRGGIATLCHICVLLLVTGKRRGKDGCSWKAATLRRSFQKHHWAWTQLEPICNVSNVIFPINKNILLGSLRPGPGAFCFRNGSYRGYENEWTERSVWEQRWSNWSSDHKERVVNRPTVCVCKHAAWTLTLWIIGQM